MINRIKRKAFADFLDKLVEGQTNREDWFNYIIEHYSDKRLEEIRVEIVRLRISAGDSEIFPSTDEHQERLKNWAEELRQNFAD